MAPSLRSLLAYAGTMFSPVQPHAEAVSYTPLSLAPSCPLDVPLSCHNTTAVADDSCCFVYPHGRFALSHVWKDLAQTPEALDSWTLGGLRPLRCDGTFDTDCQLSPQFNNVTAVLQHYGQDELLAFMDRYWLGTYGPWEQEYNGHATCINTLAPSCYGDSYRSGLEVVDYFVRAVALFRALDTYYALERAEIAPHPTRRYALAGITTALEQFSGGRVVLQCRGSKNDTLHSVTYVYHVKGSLQTGHFVPARDLTKEGDAANCAPTVRYLPKRPNGDEL